ncbi:MAG: LytTR family transcriptional regulator DNA-binding domain-containing protein [Bryobacteraceae bacterium]|nr:LytTR family transcriptional regulator DNA-binding domain-containing protein [Bryobacteraceae bacterium]
MKPQLARIGRNTINLDAVVRIEEIADDNFQVRFINGEFLGIGGTDAKTLRTLLEDSAYCWSPQEPPYTAGKIAA